MTCSNFKPNRDKMIFCRVPAGFGIQAEQNWASYWQ